MPQPRARNQRRPQGRPSWWPIGAAVVIGLMIVVVGVWWGVQAGGSPPGQAPEQLMPKSSDQPRLAVDRDLIDVGRQPFERAVSAVFEVQNVGGSSLHILEEPFVELVEGC